jgi:EamA-like transporter family
MQAIFVGGLTLPHTPVQLITCVGVGLLGYGAQISLTYGLQKAKAAPAIATSYLSVVWGVGAGYFVFHETPALLSILGAVLIIRCALFVELAPVGGCLSVCLGPCSSGAQQRTGGATGGAALISNARTDDNCWVQCVHSCTFMLGVFESGKKKTPAATAPDESSDASPLLAAGASGAEASRAV